MSKASLEKLHRLHGMLADSFASRLEQDIKDNIPTDAATLGAISKFLKDNEVTADPADSSDLADLKKQFAEAQATRRSRGSNIVALATQDLKTG